MSREVRMIASPESRCSQRRAGLRYTASIATLMAAGSLAMACRAWSAEPIPASDGTIGIFGWWQGA